jgi:peroxiredoxin
MSSGWNIRTCLKPALTGIATMVCLAPGDGPLAGQPYGPGSTARAAQTNLLPKAKGSNSADAAADSPALRIPPVLLSTGHRKLCRIQVGDHLPPIELPRPSGDVTDLVRLQGKQATVVLFWHPDHWMAQGALRDLSVLAGQRADPSLAMVGIASGQPTGAVQAQLTAIGASFPQLLDTDGSVYSLVNTAADTTALPWVYVLDAEGKIVWFDIEYSEATRRELRRAIDVLMKGP